MAIRQSTTKSFFRTIYAGMTETVCLLKRENDQRAGVVRSVMVHGVKWDDIMKTGEPLQGSMTSAHRRTLYVPKVRLQDAGVSYINSLDRFRDKQGRHWQPESTTTIFIEMFENIVSVDCLRCDPPSPVL